LNLADDEIDIAELIAASLRLVEGAAADHRVELRTRLQKNLPHLRADERRVKQVMLNLLSNAVKFTPGPGTITIAAEMGARDLVITVADTGIGIAAADLPQALEQFGQVENTMTRCQDGTGLGLPLSKQLMELHGGELSIVSDPGRGTTVMLTFPPGRLIAATRDAEPASAVMPLPASRKERHRVAA
jgi:signal transduction histidine kinase